MNPARDDEERTDDHDEAEVLVELLVQRFRSVDPQIEEDRCGYQQSDERFVAVVMPPPGRGERSERDHQQ